MAGGLWDITEEEFESYFLSLLLSSPRPALLSCLAYLNTSASCNVQYSHYSFIVDILQFSRSKACKFLQNNQVKPEKIDIFNRQTYWLLLAT